jgi:apolipoprotein N-acyltransferase
MKSSAFKLQIEGVRYDGFTGHSLRSAISELRSENLLNLSFGNKLLLALISGAVNIAIFPKANLSFLAWVCLAPLLIACYREARSGRAFLLGLAAGVVFFFGACYWIIEVLKNYGGLSWVGAFLSFLLLVVYRSLFYAVFSLAFSKVSLRFPTSCFYLSPFLWVASEYVRAHLLTGFPWCLLGYAVVDYQNLAQLATLTGVYGLSFLIALVNSVIAALILNPGKASVRRLVVTSLALCGFAMFHAWTREEASEGRQKVRLVQTNIDLEQKWDLESKLTLLDELSRLSLRGSGERPLPAADDPEITIWPETPAPFYFNQDPIFRRRMERLAGSLSGYLLFGFVDLRTTQEGQDPREPYNSVALLSPKGGVIAQYDKMHLVPFGEYVPFGSLFSFVEKISTEAGNFKAGNRLVVATLSQGHKLSAFICYEAIFPELIRRFASNGAEVFVNVTNDGWFGNSSAPFQHLNMARLRAIENHRYLLRAANNGISAVIDPYGRILKKTRLNERSVLQSGFEFQSHQTFYTRHGDVFSWLCMGITFSVAGVMAGRIKRRAR